MLYTYKITDTETTMMELEKEVKNLIKELDSRDDSQYDLLGTLDVNARSLIRTLSSLVQELGYDQ